jgi:hypothetical protein
MLVFGAAVGYSDPKTISSQGAVRKMPDGTLNTSPTGFGKYPPGGIQEFAPTCMVAVPKIWDILKKGVRSVMGEQSVIVQSLFLAAFAARSAALSQGRYSPLCDLMFKKTYQVDFHNKKIMIKHFTFCNRHSLFNLIWEVSLLDVGRAS